MSHIEIYKIKGRRYRYEVTNFKVGKKVRHTKKYLGPVEPVNAQRKNPNAGRKPALKVRVITSEDCKYLAAAIKNSKSFVKDRAKIIQLSSEGNTVKQICRKLKFHRPKVEKIIKSFNGFGLKIFERKKGSGRPRTISEEQRARVIETLNTNPVNLGLHFNNWSRVKLSDYLKEKGIIICPSYVGKIIKIDEIRYKKKRSKMYSNDKNFLRNIR